MTAELQLVERAKQGDGEAFAALYEAHKRRIYAACVRMTGNAAEAEDLTQEIFLQAFRKLGQFRGASKFATWLYRIAINSVLMKVRQQPIESILFDEVNHALGRDLRLAGVTDRIDLQRALDELAPGYRRSFLLHHVHGLQHNEIAELTGRSIGTSKSELARAKYRLRGLLTRPRPLGKLAARA